MQSGHRFFASKSALTRRPSSSTRNKKSGANETPQRPFFAVFSYDRRYDGGRNWPEECYDSTASMTASKIDNAKAESANRKPKSGSWERPGVSLSIHQRWQYKPVEESGPTVDLLTRILYCNNLDDIYIVCVYETMDGKKRGADVTGVPGSVVSRFTFSVWKVALLVCVLKFVTESLKIFMKIDVK